MHLGHVNYNNYHMSFIFLLLEKEMAIRPQLGQIIFFCEGVLSVIQKMWKELSSMQVNSSLKISTAMVNHERLCRLGGGGVQVNMTSAMTGMRWSMG